MSQNESIAEPSRLTETSRAQRETAVGERVVVVVVVVVVVQPSSCSAMLTHTHRLDRAERGGIRGQCNADIESVRQGCRLRKCDSESSRPSGTVDDEGIPTTVLALCALVLCTAGRPTNRSKTGR